MKARAIPATPFRHAAWMTLVALAASAALAAHARPQQEQTQSKPDATPPAQTQTAPAPNSKLAIDQIIAHVPRRVASKDGKPGDMVNFLLIGTRDQVEKALEAADWVPVDLNVQDAVTHAIQDVLAHRAYSQMPMSPLYLFGRPQDMGYAQGIPLAVMQDRDHFRLWRVPWLAADGQTVWAGAGTHDTGFERDPTGKLTHSIDPNVDRERDHIAQSLREAGVVKQVRYFTPKDPLRRGLTATDDNFFSDGRLAVIWLKK